MTKSKLQGKLTICKSSNGTVLLRIEDSNSLIQFLEIEIPLADFSEALFGLAYRPCSYSIIGTDVLGKQRYQEDYIFEINTFRNIEQAKLTAITLSQQDPIWNYSSYFGSQDSFFSKDGKYYAKTTRYKYI
jgi:hypothetical protein